MSGTTVHFRPVQLTVALSADAAELRPADLDLLFDQFRRAELSLGFAHTGEAPADNGSTSLGLWELSDVSLQVTDSVQIVLFDVNVRVEHGRLPVRPLLATLDAALSVSLLAQLLWLGVTISPRTDGSAPEVGSALAPDLYSSAVLTESDLAVLPPRKSELEMLERRIGGHGAPESFRPAHLCRAFEEHLAQATSEDRGVHIRIGRAY